MKTIKPYESLSPLEQDVLKILWPDKKLRVRQIYGVLSKKRGVALSSIAVILDRLYEKNIVDRGIEKGRGGTRYIYFPMKNKEELEISMIENTVNKLIEKFGSTAISYFDGRFSKGGNK
ncbi:BlaI/MecI/CopY family transcriptional regulator [Candidatus Woesearchaeota archaeon]|nr:BlaI/MecI/CopY family transcriptional regulator [Candidatus Woesearchaeota archaeon]